MTGRTYAKARHRVRQWVWALWLCCLPVNAWSQVVEYIHTDALGSPVAVTNAAGQVIERTGYAPYGEKLGKPNDDRPGYTGHVMDSATGLTYMQQRYYDPQIGRFLSTDPVQANANTGANFNRYWYANNNPYRFTDPDGRWAEDAVIGIPSILIGSKSFVDNVRVGNVGSAIVDIAGIVVDAAAIATPGVPGGAGLGIKAARGIDRAVDAGRATDGAKSLKTQAADLVQPNAGKNRVEIRSPSQMHQTDLAGKSHGGVDTPHTKISQRNLDSPNQPAYNTKKAETNSSTQQDIRNARRYLERRGR